MKNTVRNNKRIASTETFRDILRAIYSLFYIGRGVIEDAHLLGHKRDIIIGVLAH